MKKRILVIYKDEKKIGQTEITNTPVHNVKGMVMVLTMQGHVCKIMRA